MVSFKDSFSGFLNEAPCADLISPLDSRLSDNFWFNFHDWQLSAPLVPQRLCVTCLPSNNFIIQQLPSDCSRKLSASSFRIPPHKDKNQRLRSPPLGRPVIISHTFIMIFNFCTQVIHYLPALFQVFPFAPASKTLDKDALCIIHCCSINFINFFQREYSSCEPKVYPKP